MGASAPAVRLRQAVLVARELEPLVARLRGLLGLDEPFRDPGVSEFGLSNAVFAIGDCFLEIVSPIGPGTAAGRHLDRTGCDGGYMLLFDLEDLDGARERVAQMGIRVVWQIDLPDISGTHLHPADMRGAIVSLDRSHPYGSWRWGGPAWAGAGALGKAPLGRLSSVTLSVADPLGTAVRWGQVLGVYAAEGHDGIQLDGGEVRFLANAGVAFDGITEMALELPADVRAGRETIEVGNVRLRLSDLRH